MKEIESPDYETRIAILQKKASHENVEIPYDVYCYMADIIKSNIRLTKRFIGLLNGFDLIAITGTRPIVSNVNWRVTVRPI